jgi:hypothetical protein
VLGGDAFALENTFSSASSLLPVFRILRHEVVRDALVFSLFGQPEKRSGMTIPYLDNHFEFTQQV